MKRLLSLLVVGGWLVLVLSGCSEKGSNIPTTKEMPTEKPSSGGFISGNESPKK